MSKAENISYHVKPDGFYGELFVSAEDKYPGKALICFTGSDGKYVAVRTCCKADHEAFTGA